MVSVRTAPVSPCVVRSSWTLVSLFMAASESDSQASARGSPEGTVGALANSMANCAAARYAASTVGTSDNASAGLNLPPVACTARAAHPNPNRHKTTTDTQPALELNQRTSRSFKVVEFRDRITP